MQVSKHGLLPLNHTHMCRRGAVAHTNQAMPAQASTNLELGTSAGGLDKHFWPKGPGTPNQDEGLEVEEHEQGLQFHIRHSGPSPVAATLIPGSAEGCGTSTHDMAIFSGSAKVGCQRIPVSSSAATYPRKTCKPETVLCTNRAVNSCGPWQNI